MACPAPPAREFCDPRDVGALHEPLRSIVAQLIHDAPGKGLTLVSGRRTPYMQYLLRLERCGKLWCSSSCKGHPTTALVGHSHHENRDETHCAADLGGRSLRWAIDNAARYGLWLPVRGENWHFEPHGAPKVHITPYAEWGHPPAKPRPFIGFKGGATNASIFKQGGHDNQVSELSILMTRLGYIDFPVRTTYDKALQGAWIDFSTDQRKLHPGDKLWANPSSAVNEKQIKVASAWVELQK